jgi:hypothetical protein
MKTVPRVPPSKRECEEREKKKERERENTTTNALLLFSKYLFITFTTPFFVFIELVVLIISCRLINLYTYIKTHTHSPFPHIKSVHELHLLLRENCMIRRLKTEILKSLPPKTRRRVEVQVEDVVLREHIKQNFIDFLTRSGEAATLAKKKSRLMQIAEKFLLERTEKEKDTIGKVNSFNGKIAAAVSPSRTSSSSSSSSSFQGAADDEASSKELAQQRKSLLMSLYKDTGIAKLVTIYIYIY